MLTGLDIEAKAALVRAQLARARRPSRLDARPHRPPGRRLQEEARRAAALRRCTDPDPKAVGRAFTGAAVELALASYPGFT